MKRVLILMMTLLAMVSLPGRAGAETLAESCADIGLEKDPHGLLCYEPCKEGYKGVGPVCWQECPSRYTDTGGHCLKPKAYGRGAGYPWKFGDKLGSLAKAKHRCEKAHASCEKDGAIYYPKCDPGFHAVGCCTCSPDCPSGMTDIGVSCQKKSYGRGVGKPIPELLSRMKKELEKGVKATWELGKKLSCSGLADKAFSYGSVNRTPPEDWGAKEFVGSCGQEFTKGLVRSIPDAFLDTMHLAQESLEVAWKHRKVCFTAALLAGVLVQGPQPTAMIGPLACGAGYMIKEKVPKAFKCLTAANGSGSKKIWAEMGVGIACNLIGSLVPDVIIAIVTGGAEGPPLVAQKIAKLTASLSERVPATVAKDVAKMAKLKDGLTKLNTAFKTLDKAQCDTN